jgi:hypothetical protein
MRLFSFLKFQTYIQTNKNKKEKKKKNHTLLLLY